MIGRRTHDDAQAFDQAWSGGAPRDAHVADLVRIAEELYQSAAEVQPAADFRDALRTRLMADAATVLTPLPPETRRTPAAAAPARHGRRRLATATAALVASAGAAGIVASSASALPGEMLYPVKRSAETVELQLHRSDASRGSFQLSQAAERLAEARRLSADAGAVDLIAETLEDFSSTAAEGSTSLFAAYADSGQDTTIRQVNHFAVASSLDLSQLGAQLPADAADAFTAATTVLTDLAAEASTLCASCEAADVRALADSVAEQAERAGTPAGRSADSATKTASPPPAIPTPVSGGSRARTPAPLVTGPRPPATPAPLVTGPRPPATPAPPVATTKAPSLTDLTDPLLGGLLGTRK
jgi:hypothetical protein